ncbi:hypothetical protein ECG_03611 [Echinococcus granulosus]|nr:hypothetical protein ECG_03611 [Echinococcus granulosus]
MLFAVPVLTAPSASALVVFSPDLLLIQPIRQTSALLLPADSSTHSSSVTATTARSCNTTTSTPTSLPTSQKASAIGTHMASLAAVLEALLVGLNTYVRQLVVPRRGANLFSALPPFASGSVFCGPLDMTKTKEDQETEIVESFLHLFLNRDSTAVKTMDTSYYAPRQTTIVIEERLQNSTQVMFVLRVYITYTILVGLVGTLSPCTTVGSAGLREHRFPPPVATVTADVSPHAAGRSRWQRFARHHHQERHSKGAPPPSLPLEPRASTPLRGSQRQSDRVIAAAARLDTRITAPLRSVPAVQRGTSTSMDMQPSLNMVGPCDYKDAALIDTKGKAEENDSENDFDLSILGTPTSSVTNTDSSGGTSVETGSNASLCSDDDVNVDVFDGSFDILNEEGRRTMRTRSMRMRATKAESIITQRRSMMCLKANAISMLQRGQ